MKRIDHSQLENLVVRCYNSQLPLFVYGGFGIGKSDTIRKVSKELSDGRKYVNWNQTTYDKKKEIINNAKDYFVLKDTRLSQLDPSDINGIPDIGGDTKYLKWNPPSWAVWSSQEDAKGFLFFDEANLASPAVMKAFYQVVHDREVGDIPVSDGVGIVSAGNRLKDKAGVNMMPKPLQDRYFEVELKEPTVEEWEEWAVEHSLDPYIIAFLRMNREFLYMPRGDQSEHKPATPRGWEQVSQILGKIENNTDPEYLDFLRTTVSSRLGEDVAHEFVSFLETQSEIDIRDYINNPASEPIPDSSDLKWTLVCGIVNWYRGLSEKEKKEKGLETALTIANQFDHKDFAINLGHQIKNSDKEVFEEVDGVDVWSDNLGSDWFDFLTGGYQ